ncbi:uncharacterized protein LOC144875042 [Branchiostoma floridae x Branchiostoma japonicum]
MPGCCGSGGEERTGNSQRRRRRWVLVTALVLIVFGCSVCVITVSVTVSQGKQMRFPYEGMALLAIGVGMMVVHSNCGVQKISRRAPRLENNGVPDTREPQRPPDAPPAYWTVFSLFSSNESPDSTVPPPTSVDSTSLPGSTAQLPPVVVIENEQSPAPPLPPLPTPAVLDVSALTLPVMSTSPLPSSPPPSYPASRCDPDEQNGGTEDFSDTDSLPPEYDDITDNNSGNVESVTTRL